VRDEPHSATSRQRPVSRTGCVTCVLAVDDYLRLLDWTGRELRRDKPGSIPRELAPILERLRINAAWWPATVKQFGR